MMDQTETKQWIKTMDQNSEPGRTKTTMNHTKMMKNKRILGNDLRKLSQELKQLNFF